MKIVGLMGFCFFLLSCASIPAVDDRELSSDNPLSWKKEQGIETAWSNNSLLVIRADLTKAKLELYNSRTTPSLSVSQVASQNDYIFVINAAMFATDYITSIGYMKNFDYINNQKVNPKLRGFLLFNPKRKSSAPVRIGGEGEISDYNSAFQSHRVWSPGGGILWKKGKNIHPRIGLVGVDGENRVLFFFHPSVIDIHDLVTAILDLKLGLQGLLYLDGGNHATVWQANGSSWNTWLALPNLLGLKPSK